MPHTNTDTVHSSVADTLKAEIGETRAVAGWVRTRRDSKAGLSFIAVYDGSCFDPLQVVAHTELPNYADVVQRLTAGCSVKIVGEVVESKGKGQRVELRATSVQAVGWVQDPETYPIAAKRHTMERLREVAHLRPRTNTFGAMARVRHTLSKAVHDFFHNEGFYWVHTPIVTASDCEGAGEMFRVSTLDMENLPRDDAGKVDYGQDFFGREAHLTVSGQLNAECYCCALSKVYTFGPTFRAENSNTSRHLAEFWMIEPEIAFADLNDNAKLAERFVKACFKAVLQERADDTAFFTKRVQPALTETLEHAVNSPFERMTYTEAVDTLQKSGETFEFPVQWGAELQSEHERCLTEKIVQRPVVVTDYPKDIKAFYMRSNDDNKTVAAMDVLLPGVGELIGGAQREERLDRLDARLEEMGLHKEDYWWYRDLRRYGTVPHAGFGLGFERLVQCCTGLANIRDVIPFPRTPRNADF